MLFACTANASDTSVAALSACCPAALTADVNPRCATGAVDGLAACLQQRGEWIDSCLLTGADVHTSATDRLPASAAPAPPRPRPLGTLALAALGLALLGSAAAVPVGTGVQCARFQPAPRAEWRKHGTPWAPVSPDVPCPGPPTPPSNTSAASAHPPPSPPSRRSARSADSADSASSGGAPCPVALDAGAEWRAQFSTPNDITVGADIAALVAAAGAPYVGALRVPALAGTLFVAPGHTGHVRAWAGALMIPGTFTECSDARQYTGEAVVIDPTRIGVSLVQRP